MIDLDYLWIKRLGTYVDPLESGIILLMGPLHAMMDNNQDRILDGITLKHHSNITWLF